ncbi:MAG TPA: hypothetical protein VHA37_02860, partial [Candidatus Saccharimonadales bacterium]|nr:hypothetical protein [Candidatus Saccharimonadales bacterium]
MPLANVSTKHLAISKANAQMVAVVAGASIVTVFCLVASKAVLGTNRYLAHVISKQKTAHQQLETNLANYNGLSKAYNKFDAASPNIIGGDRDGTGQNDGPNSTIILDALPSTYDFPALTSSIEKILSDSGVQVTSISGTDDQISQQDNLSSPNPQPVDMPFSFTVTNASYASVAQLITKLQESIRPIQIDTLDITGSMNNMTVNLTAHTYYQPGKTVNVSQQVVP